MSPNPVLRAPTQQNDLAKVRELLEEGEDANQADSFAMTPICYAAQNGYKEMVRLLLEHGASPNVENKVRLRDTITASLCRVDTPLTPRLTSAILTTPLSSATIPCTWRARWRGSRS